MLPGLGQALVDVEKRCAVCRATQDKAPDVPIAILVVACKTVAASACRLCEKLRSKALFSFG